MPALKQWESYIEVVGVLDWLGCRETLGDVVEFGCRYGTFTIPLAQRTVGWVFALDIHPLIVAATTERVQHAGLKNVVVEQRDFVAQGSGRNSEAASCALLLNILHIEDPVNLLTEARRILRPARGFTQLLEGNSAVPM